MTGLESLVAYTTLGNGIFQLISNLKEKLGNKQMSDEEVLNYLRTNIKNEDLLYHYLERIKDLNNIDFLIMRNIPKIKIETRRGYIGSQPIATNFNEKYYLEELSKLVNEKLKEVPFELKKESINKLISMQILSTNKRNISMNKNLFTELGEKIYKLLN